MLLMLRNSVNSLYLIEYMHLNAYYTHWVPSMLRC